MHFLLAPAPEKLSGFLAAEMLHCVHQLIAIFVCAPYGAWHSTVGLSKLLKCHIFSLWLEARLVKVVRFTKPAKLVGCKTKTTQQTFHTGSVVDTMFGHGAGMKVVSVIYTTFTNLVWFNDFKLV